MENETKKNGMKIVCAFILLAFMASLSFAQAASSTNYLVATEVKLTPGELYAGQDAELSFVLLNTYAYDASGVVVQLQGGYPFLELSPAQAQKIVTIPDGIAQLGAEPIVFKIHADAQAPAGTYTLNVVATYSSLAETILVSGAKTTLPTVKTDTIPVAIRVRGAPHISLSPVSQGIEPGVRSSLAILVINDGTDTAKGVSLSLGNTDVFGILGTSDVYLGDIEPGRSAQAMVTLRAAENATSERHDLPVVVSYNTKEGKEFEQSSKIQIAVSVYQPELEITVDDKSSAPRAGEEAVVLLWVRNTGDGTAKNVMINTADSEPVEIKWPTQSISLGDIPANGKVSASLRVKVQDGATAQGVSLPMTVTYQSSNGQKSYETTDSLQLNIEKSASFVIEGASSTLGPGEKWKQVDFTIKNTGNVEAREIKALLNTQYPITPSGKEQYVQSLMPGESVKVSFHVDV
ncbi:MAG: hypothetical protein NT157_00555, partial [Candidatus Micrarchaeota archaeon]|nr:hypothetical protein [Candidatus Micrarchaeota archaeon]